MKIKGRMHFAMLLILAACWITANAQLEDPHWKVVNDGNVPLNAEIGGTDGDGLKLPLCWSVHAGAWYPGKVFKKRCLIMNGGREFEASGPYVAYEGRVKWQNGPSITRGNLTAIPGSIVGNTVRPLCQAVLNVNSRYIGTYAGYVLDGKCNVGWGNSEWPVAVYKVGFDNTPLEAAWFQNKIYRIVSIKSGKGIKISDPNRTAGSSMLQSGDTKTTTEHWNLAWAGAGYYNIRSFTTNMCLDTRGVTGGKNAPVQLWPCEYRNSQMWSLSDYEPRQSAIVSKDTGKVLQIEPATIEDGAAIYLSERTNAPFQLWRFETVITPTSMQFQCESSLDGKVAWNRAGNKKWDWGNTQTLCRATKNPDATIACFTDLINKTDNWSQAIESCRAK